jgi:hypothetical protein
MKISTKNREDRRIYGSMHEGKSLMGYWQYQYFTDEAHFDAQELSYAPQYELQIEGAPRGDDMQESNTAIFTGKVHVVGGVTYNHKGHFGFYRDPAETTNRTYQRSRPKRSSVETDAEYQKKVDAYDLAKFRKIAATPKGNSMTMDYYCDKILPHHIAFLDAMRAKHGRTFEFIEDGDPSHGMRTTNNRAARMKKDADIINHWHPAQSPDLNPIEAVWNIMKQRLRGRRWTTREEFIEDIEIEWKRVSQAQIRRRVREMPHRCIDVQKLKGQRIRSDLW